MNVKKEKSSSFVRNPLERVGSNENFQSSKEGSVYVFILNPTRSTINPEINLEDANTLTASRAHAKRDLRDISWIET